MSETPQTGAPSNVFRIGRYVSTIFNLWLAPVRSRPFSEFAIICSGMIARLAPLVAFIVTVQFAVWLIVPERSPEGVRRMLGYAQDPFLFNLVIISVPIGVFLLGSAAQRLQDHLLLQVRRVTAFSLIEAGIPERLENLEGTAPEVRAFLTDVRADYQTVHRSVQSINNIINSLVAVMTAAGIGFLIAPYFVAILLAGLSVLAALFVAWRHGETNRLLEHKQVMLKKEIELQKGVQSELMERSSDLSSEECLMAMRSFLANAIGNPNELDDRFKSNTNFVSAFGPLIGVTALLGFLALESEVTEERAAQLIMLVLVLRFCIGNIQSVVAAMVGLTRDYVRLSRLFSGPAFKELNPLADESMDVSP